MTIHMQQCMTALSMSPAGIGGARCVCVVVALSRRVIITNSAIRMGVYVSWCVCVLSSSSSSPCVMAVVMRCAVMRMRVCRPHIPLRHIQVTSTTTHITYRSSPYHQSGHIYMTRHHAVPAYHAMLHSKWGYVHAGDNDDTHTHTPTMTTTTHAHTPTMTTTTHTHTPTMTMTTHCTRA